MTKYAFVSKNEAFKIYKQSRELKIGFQNKDAGATWDFYMFEKYGQGNSSREMFDSIVSYFKKRVLPHTRIKYFAPMTIVEELGIRRGV